MFLGRGSNGDFLFQTARVGPVTNVTLEAVHDVQKTEQWLEASRQKLVCAAPGVAGAAGAAGGVRMLNLSALHHLAAAPQLGAYPPVPVFQQPAVHMVRLPDTVAHVPAPALAHVLGPQLAAAAEQQAVAAPVPLAFPLLPLPSAPPAAARPAPPEPVPPASKARQPRRDSVTVLGGL